ncbi:MAG TPA: HAMP domain-containing sensor histidine kinase [Longimicrobium sp.]|nr:HAMP domain-containing sensor histidine kinase [Longimicrobium sp.]
MNASMMVLLAQTAPLPCPDTRIMFGVSVVVVVSVAVFTAAVIITLLRRSDRRRAEEEKVAAIGTATARILHQIKNPLQTVVLNADILQDERIVSDAAGRREVCEAIVSESQRLVSMLDELSVYASGARRALARQPVLLHEIVGQLARQEERDASIQVDAGVLGEAVVFADPYYLRQVFENLVRNACEAMHDQDDRRLTLRVESAAGSAEVRVMDNGPGIEAEKLDQIFQPFVSTKGKGMGLGLAICREIVEGHGGRLEVESTPGVGATFIVRLPLYDAAALEAGAGRAAEAWV